MQTKKTIFCSSNRYSYNMKQKSKIVVILAVIFQLSVVSCIRDEPCTEVEEKEIVDVVITDLLPDSLATFEDLNMRTVNLSFYRSSDNCIFTRTLLGDNGKITLPDGSYSVLVYTSDFFELDAVFYRGMEHPETAEAYARQQTENGVLYVEEPDPLFCSYIEDFNPDEHFEKLSIVLQPKVFTYRFKIAVEGIQYLQSAVAMVTGMYTSSYLKDGHHRESEEAAMRVQLKKTEVNPEKNEGYLYGEFRSFGSHQRKDVKHRLSIALTNGETKIVELDDLTASIKSMPHGGEVVIKQKIVIKDNGGGGQGSDFNPGLTDWDDIEIPVPA